MNNTLLKLLKAPRIGNFDDIRMIEKHIQTVNLGNKNSRIYRCAEHLSFNKRDCFYQESSEDLD